MIKVSLFHSQISHIYGKDVASEFLSIYSVLTGTNKDELLEIYESITYLEYILEKTLKEKSNEEN